MAKAQVYNGNKLYRPARRDSQLTFYHKKARADMDKLIVECDKQWLEWQKLNLLVDDKKLVGKAADNKLAFLASAGNNCSAYLIILTNPKLCIKMTLNSSWLTMMENRLALTKQIQFLPFQPLIAFHYQFVHIGAGFFVYRA